VWLLTLPPYCKKIKNRIGREIGMESKNTPVIGKDALGREIRDLSKIPWWGVDRKAIEWYPVINYDKCATCGICFVTCGRRVFDFDRKEGKVIVARPYNCMVACQTCMNLCPTGAISFPDVSYIKKLVAQNKIVKKAFEIIKPLLPDEHLSTKETETNPEP
jgi:NAD-dependent dihydropyrimidine dehydrogenase PreA subunit